MERRTASPSKPRERSHSSRQSVFEALLSASGAKYKVVIVSACYSGIFTPLADADTLVITAASATRSSFGCKDGNVWTYFGEAFFANALRRTSSLTDAFETARAIIAKS